jgi:circadian clock protein KaiC
MKYNKGVFLERDANIIETGIHGLDSMLNGGIPSKNQVLLTGGPGTGKTLLSFELLYNCAKNGIPSAFITLDERSDNVIKNAKKTFPSMDGIDELLKRKLLIVDGSDAATKMVTTNEEDGRYSMGNLFSTIEDLIKAVDAQVAVIDSLSFLKLMFGKTPTYGKAITSLVSNMRRLAVTAIYCLDIPYYSRNRMKFGQELLLFDGLMYMYKDGKPHDVKTKLEIIKMRGCEHKKFSGTYSITPEGIRLE